MLNRGIVSEWKEIKRSLEVVVIYDKVFFWTVSVPAEIKTGFFCNRNRKHYRMCHLVWFFLINKLFSARTQ